MAINNMDLPSLANGQGVGRSLSLALWRFLLAPPDERGVVLREIKDLLESEGFSEG